MCQLLRLFLAFYVLPWLATIESGTVYLRRASGGLRHLGIPRSHLSCFRPPSPHPFGSVCCVSGWRACARPSAAASTHACPPVLRRMGRRRLIRQPKRGRRTDVHMPMLLATSIPRGLLGAGPESGKQQPAFRFASFLYFSRLFFVSYFIVFVFPVFVFSVFVFSFFPFSYFLFSRFRIFVFSVFVFSCFPFSYFRIFRVFRFRVFPGGEGSTLRQRGV